MTAYSLSGLTFSGAGTLSGAIPRQVGTSALSDDLSGIVYEQAAPISTVDDFVEFDDSFIYQTFKLPANYPRGTYGPEIRIPELTGLQINVGVALDFADTAALDFRIDYFDEGWIGLAEGTRVGGSADGDQVWFTVNFEPVDVTDIWFREFRFGIKGRDPNIAENQDLELETDGKTFAIGESLYSFLPDISPAPLVPGKTYPFVTDDGIPSVIRLDNGSYFYSAQGGIDRVWYSTPNPLAVSGFKAYTNDGVTPISGNAAQEVSFRFRILAAAPSSDIDYFGNDYRTAVTANPPSNVGGDIDLRDNFWLSKPNPSPFAVESMYFDLSDGTDPVVTDHIVIDPVTPGINMNIYYSSDPAPGIDTQTWDALLWTPVGQNFDLDKKETFTFPEPVTARYFKLEFTHLQPRYYSPGTLQLPLAYSKHPKWVLDYFLAIYQQRRSQSHEFSRSVNVTYDALDLAYQYFLDDLQQNRPALPTTISDSDAESAVKGFLDQEATQENNQIDAETLLRIKTSFTPFLTNPFTQGRFGEILADYAAPRTDLLNNYTTELPVNPIANTTQVSSLDRDILVIEKIFPIMSFYIPCRHYYKQTLGRFEQDRAYFAGIKEIAFTREHYASVFDHDQYNESAGDNINMERNDFVTVDQTWETSSAIS